MKFSIRVLLAGALIMLVGLGLLVLGAAAGGLYNFAADEQHSRPVFALIEYARQRSINTRSAALEVPNLSGPDRVKKGAGNYDAMCAQCHLAPQKDATELSRGLYPAPPNLSKVPVTPAAAFWVIKRGIKASGMPAWGESMSDEDIWNLVAFLQQLRQLDGKRYQELVASSSGHSHSSMHPASDGQDTMEAGHAHGGGEKHGDEQTSQKHQGAKR